MDFEYIVSNDYTVNIRNNNLNNNDTVYIDVSNENELVTYSFYVHKDNINYISSIDNYKKSLEVKSSNDIQLYKVQLLSIGLFLSIIIVFSIIFGRKKIYK